MGVSLADVLGLNNLVDDDDVNLYPMYKSSTLREDNIPIVDDDWVRSRFMVSGEDLNDIDRKNRFFTTTHWKFTDTTLGGNIALNARPQPCRYTDIRHGGRLATNKVKVNSTSGGYGMGRYYSESIDDNATTIYMEFGIPKFNSIISFFTRAIDGIDAYIAKNGRMPNGYQTAKTVGQALAFIFFPLTSIIIFAGKTLAEGLSIAEHNFNFYYFESAMHMYWGSVNTIVTVLATELGIVIPQLDSYGAHSADTGKKIGTPAQFINDDLQALNKLFPQMVWGTNYIDVFAIATRSQRIANSMLLREFEQYSSGNSSDSDFYGYVKTYAADKEFKSEGSTLMDGINYYTSFDGWLSRIMGNDSLYTKEQKIEDNPAVKPTSDTLDTNSASTVGSMPVRNSDGSYDIELNASEREYNNAFMATLDSTIRDGGMYLCLNVDYQGPVSESFSNSVGEIQIKDAIKSVAKGVQDIRFNFAGGAISETIDNAVNTVKSVAAGLLEGVTFGLSNVIFTLLQGYVDIPKKWEESSASFPSITYKTRLVSPYANPVSQLQNIYIPLACLLAGTLPLAAGKMSYQSPFLCTIFNKGVQNIKLGMITSLTIERGTSNLGFTKNKKALAIDVSFTVTDFSELLTTPINRTTFESAFSVSLEDDKPLNKYLAVVASRDIITNKYLMPKIKLALSRKLMGINQMVSPQAWAMRIGEKFNSVLGPMVLDRNINQNQTNTLF